VQKDPAYIKAFEGILKQAQDAAAAKALALVRTERTQARAEKRDPKKIDDLPAYIQAFEGILKQAQDAAAAKALALVRAQRAAARGAAAAQQAAAKVAPAAAPVSVEKEATPQEKGDARAALKKLFAPDNMADPAVTAAINAAAGKPIPADAAPEVGWQKDALTAVDNLQPESSKAPQEAIRFAVPDLIVYAENLLLTPEFHENKVGTPPATRVEGLKNNKPDDKINTAIDNIAIAAQEKPVDLWKIMEIVIQVRDEATQLLAAEEKKLAAAK
jgi:hypothetical protein